MNKGSGSKSEAPSEISLRLRFSTQQNQGERLPPGNLGGKADRLVLAYIVEKRDVEMLFCTPASFNVGLCLAV